MLAAQREAIQIPGLSSTPCRPRTTPPAVGLTLLDTQRVDARITRLTFASRAIGGTVHADVMLPVSYAANPSLRYPVLYLLHGHAGSSDEWARHGVEGMIGRLPVVVVMPDGGYDGWYSDWYGSDSAAHMSAAPAWETFHLRELLPYIDAHYRTIAARSGRAIAGVSMGGYGAMLYAAHHPDLFAAAGSFSGAVDMELSTSLVSLTQEAARDFPGYGPDACTWGDPRAQAVVWRDHDPTTLARNLRGVALFLASGNGLLPDFSDLNHHVESAFIEATVYQMNLAFSRALAQQGIPYTSDFYGRGLHDWSYWGRDLRTFLPWVMAALAAPRRTPPAVPFSFQSAAAPFSVWGWTFWPHRRVQEFAYLDRVSASGFTAAGSGTLHVDTAPLYSPNGLYTVAGLGGTQPSCYRADADGRLHVDVDLGPSHTLAQRTFGPSAERSFRHALVSIAAAGRASACATTLRTPGPTPTPTATASVQSVRSNTPTPTPAATVSSTVAPTSTAPSVSTGSSVTSVPPTPSSVG